MSTLTWLHLSDLHFRKGEQQAWDRDIVLRTLLDDVRERIAKDGLHPDFIVVSGDVGFSGSLDEYAKAGMFFDDLLAATHLSRERLFVVPGNHDVDRTAISVGARAIATSLDSRQSLSELLTSPLDRQIVFRRLYRYAEFVNSYFGPGTFDDEHYYFARTAQLSGLRVAVLGLNSAWLARGGDEDRGRLALGERQVRAALDASRQADLRIAVMHHPFDWLLDFDRDDCEALLAGGCHFILHGHLHRSGLLSLETPDEAAMIIAAGASYETRQSMNGYNIVQIDPISGQGTIHLRAYSDKRGGFWTADVMSYRNVDKGQYEFALPRLAGTSVTGKTRAPKAPSGPSVDPAALEANYLRRVQVACNTLPLAIIDPRAVERTRQHTMNLLAVYIALQTRTQVAAEGAGEGKKKAAREEQRRRQGVPAGMESRETRPLPALEATANDRLMVLLGDPGSGKSTFANYLALCLASGRLEAAGQPGSLPGEKWLAHLEPGWTHGPLLPLRVTLRHFAASGRCNGRAAGLWDFVEDGLATEGLLDYAPHLRKRLLDGGVLVLLDGLDEVADPAERQRVVASVADFAATYGHPANRYLVTCRTYAYQDPCCRLERFTDHGLAPFDQEQIDAFIGSWYEEVCRLGWKSPGEAEELTRRLQEATRRSDLAPLAANPLQLAMMASLHFSWGKLPDDRAELYQEMVRLLLVRWQEARLGEETGVTQAVSAGKLESALKRVAFVAQRSQQRAEGPADIPEATLLSVFKDELSGSWDKARELLTFIQERAGLLIWRGPEVYAFPHRSYQEYLAGAYLAVQPDYPDEVAALAASNYAQWREVALWSVGVTARLNGYLHITVDVASALCPRETPDTGVAETESDWRLAALAGEALLEAGLHEVMARPRHVGVLARIRRWLVALVEQGALNPVDRSRAADVLARLGDPRKGVGLTADPATSGHAIPDIAWCEVAAGPFLMGNTKQTDAGADADEMPQQKLTLPAFRISKYPVTNAQFGAFVADGGYTERWQHCWTVAGWQWKGDRAEPERFRGVFDLPNHPVVMVSWYEAFAFCRWLSEKLGYQVSLPTEAQWEKAARGADGRRYPWVAPGGASEITPDHANYDATGIGTTSAVGIFPRGASPYGVLDMSGNAWEWCQTKWQGNYKAREDNDPAGAGARVLRGGAFRSGAGSVRCAVRNWDNPNYRLRSIGFRVVVSPVV